MTAKEIQKVYVEELRKMNEDMVAATSPEWGRLVSAAKDAAVVIEALDGVVEKEEARLKVFQITMYDEQEFGEHFVTDIIVALGADEDSVCKLVFGNLGYDSTREVKDKTYQVVEVEGPFGQGSLLYRHKIINE